MREPVRIERERLRGDDAHHLPVARRRVLALRALDQATGDGRRSGLRRAALERLDVPEAEGLHVRQIESADGLRDVSERVRALVAVLAGVGQLAGPHGVEDDHTGSAVSGASASGYSRFGMSNVLGLLGFVVYMAVIVGVAAGITMLVVRFSPSKKPKTDS